MNPNVRAWLENAVDSIKHWVWVVVCTFGGALGTYVLHYFQTSNPLSIIADLQTKAGIAALLTGAVGASVTAVLSMFKMPSNAAARLAKVARGNNTGGGSPSGGAPVSLRRSILPHLGPILTLVVLLFLFAGCGISSAPIVVVTPSNQAQVDSCQKTAAVHNDFVIGDFVFTGAATGVAGAVPFVSDSNAKNTLAITGVGLGAAAIIGSGVVALTASNFSNSKCSLVVGDLPAAVKGVERGTP